MRPQGQTVFVNAPQLVNVVSDPLQNFLDIAFSESEEPALLRKFGAWLDGRIASTEARLFLFDSATATFSPALLRSSSDEGSLVSATGHELFEAQTALLQGLSHHPQLAQPETSPGAGELVQLFNELFNLPPRSRYFPITVQTDFLGVLCLSESATNVLCLPKVTKEIEAAAAALCKALQRIWQAEELELAGHISPGLAHDLQNYLTPISTVLQLAREQKSHPTPELLELALDNVKLLDEHLREALSLNTPLVFTKSVNLAACVQQATRLISTKAADKKVTIVAQGSDAASVTGASGLLFRLIANLLKNAVEAAPTGSQVAVAWQSTANGWELSVSDSGTGIPAEARAQMLATRFREKPASLAGRGSGLGLAICRAVTRLHHGRLHLLARVPHGTLIRVELPNFR